MSNRDRPVRRSGEKVEDFDVGYVGRVRIDLIATDRTLWLFPSAGGDLVKLPYSDINVATWQRTGPSSNGVLGIVTRSGQNVMLEIQAPRDLARDLASRFRG